MLNVVEQRLNGAEGIELSVAARVGNSPHLTSLLHSMHCIDPMHSSH